MKIPRNRLIMAVLIVITIGAGLLSRHYPAIPTFIGDILWATMVYFIVRFFLIKGPAFWLVLYSLLFCYIIEFSQLYKSPEMEKIRHTLFGRLVLGETFLWSDLLCYAIGVGLGVFIEKNLLKGEK